MMSSQILNHLISALPDAVGFHDPDCRMFEFMKETAHKEVKQLFADEKGIPVDLGPFGEITVPYHKMGAVDSLDLFHLHELIIFSFYWLNRGNYKRVLDLGANIGLHSIILSKCGFEVKAFEPDPVHFDILTRNLEMNSCTGVETVKAAVSIEAGTSEFIRVNGNTTSSHLAGSKKNPYGPLEIFPVETVAVAPLLQWADLVKMDIEGQEDEILLSTSYEDWENLDALVEISDEEKAGAIYSHFKKLGVNLFPQSRCWQKAESVKDIPCHFRDGMLFISTRKKMNWPAAGGECK